MVEVQQGTLGHGGYDACTGHAEMGDKGRREKVVKWSDGIELGWWGLDREDTHDFRRVSVDDTDAKPGGGIQGSPMLVSRRHQGTDRTGAQLDSRHPDGYLVAGVGRRVVDAGEGGQTAVRPAHPHLGRLVGQADGQALQRHPAQLSPSFWVTEKQKEQNNAKRSQTAKTV